jgi:hypothetical protein
MYDGSRLRMRPRGLASLPLQGALVAGLILGDPGTLAAARPLPLRATAEKPVGPVTTSLPDHVEDAPFTPDELETLVGPVALYPDELLGIVLPAATYPLQIVQAARFLERHAQDDALEPDPGWDQSVLGLLNYPEVVDMMNSDLNWTWQLGEAVANQQQDVMDAVQRFRHQTREAGNLVTNDRVVVSEQEGEGEPIVIIESASPEVIYVPVYRPSTVVVYYGTPYPWYWTAPYPYYYHRRAIFWTGMWVGAGVGYGCRWGHHGDSSVTIDRNVDIDIDRPGSGSRPARPERPGSGDRPAQRPEAKPATSARDWKPSRDRGLQSGARPGHPATRPGGGRAPTRPATGALPDRPGGTRPAQGATRPATGSIGRTRPLDRATRPVPSPSPRPSGASRHDGSFGRYQPRSSTERYRGRGGVSRAPRGGGVSRGGGRARGGGRGGRR